MVDKNEISNYYTVMSYKNLPLNCPGKIFFGRLPSEEEMLILKEKETVNTVWNLLMELPWIIAEEKTVFTNVLNSPIQDYSVPQDDSNFFAILEEICLKLEAGQNIFVHCLGGRGRTGMALAALLIKINKMSTEKALDLTDKICGGPELESQKDFIRNSFSL